jgi:hypothetical protein
LELYKLVMPKIINYQLKKWYNTTQKTG